MRTPAVALFGFVALLAAVAAVYPAAPSGSVPWKYTLALDALKMYGDLEHDWVIGGNYRLEITNREKLEGKILKVLVANTVPIEDTKKIGSYPDGTLTISSTTGKLALSSDLQQDPGKKMALAFFLGGKHLPVVLESQGRAAAKTQPHVKVAFREAVESGGPEQGALLPPSKPEDESLENYEGEFSQAQKDHLYHIFLRPDGREYFPAKYPLLRDRRPVAGQCIRVHWLAYGSEWDDYNIAWEGELYRPGATVWGSFEGLQAPPSEPAKFSGALAWKKFDLPASGFKGGTTLKITRLWKGKRVRKVIELYIHRRDRYALRAGFITTPLGRYKITTAPGSGQGTSVIAHTDQGRQIEGVVTLFPSVWGERDFTAEPDVFLAGINPFLGTTTSDFAKTWLYGVHLELAPGCELLYGRIMGKRDALKPGYHVGETFDGKIEDIRTEIRDSERFWGVTFSTAFWKSVFQKATK